MVTGYHKVPEDKEELIERVVEYCALPGRNKIFHLRELYKMGLFDKRVSYEQACKMLLSYFQSHQNVTRRFREFLGFQKDFVQLRKLAGEVYEMAKKEKVYLTVPSPRAPYVYKDDSDGVGRFDMLKDLPQDAEMVIWVEQQ